MCLQSEAVVARQRALIVLMHLLHRQRKDVRKSRLSTFTASKLSLGMESAGIGMRVL